MDLSSAFFIFLRFFVKKNGYRIFAIADSLLTKSAGWQSLTGAGVFFVLFAVGVQMYGRRKERKKAITACKSFLLHAVPYSFADALNIGKSITLYPLPVARVCQCSELPFHFGETGAFVIFF